MYRLAKHAGTIVVAILLGGLLGASLVRFAPGYGVDEQELDSRLSNTSIETLRAANQTKESIVVFYAHYLTGLAHGDWGYSRTLNRPVRQLIAERLPETLKTLAIGVALGWALGLAFAVPVSMSRTRTLDTIAGIATGFLLCIPAAVFSLLFVLARAPSRPIIAFIIFPKVFRYSRNLLVRSANLPHVLTAWSKGLGKTRIFLFHVLPTSAPQLLALAGVTISIAFTAAIPVEALCDVPGIGQLAWKAALGRDLSLLINLTMIVTVLTLAANSISDLVAGRRSHA